MAYGVGSPGRSQGSHHCGGRGIATVRAYCEHKSCAVKLHAYTLDSSIICASALQHKLLFPQPLVNARLLRIRHGKGWTPQGPNALSSTLFARNLSQMPKPERTAAILVAAGRGLRAGTGGPKQYRSIGGGDRNFSGRGGACAAVSHL